MSYWAKLSGEDLSRHTSQTEPVHGSKKSLVLGAKSAIWLKVLQNIHISLPYNMAARTAGIDRNVEITSLSPYLYNTSLIMSRIQLVW